MRRRRIYFATVATIAALIGIGAWAVGLLGGLESDSVDQRFTIRGEVSPDSEPGLALVLVDDNTFSNLGEQWPFPRSLHATVINRLKSAGAKVIAYDVQFTEQTERREDNALIVAVMRAGNVVLSTTEVDEQGRGNVFGGDDVVRQLGASVGNTVVGTEDDGVIRKFSDQVQGMTSFPVEAAKRAGTRVDGNDFQSGQAWIDFAGPAGTIPAVSFSRVVRGNFDPGLFRDKVVVVGPSAPTLQDVHATAAGGGLMPGPEVMANAISTILEGFPLKSAPGWLELALIVLMAAVTPLVGYRFKPLLTGLVAAGAAGLFLVLAQVAFNGGWIVPVVYPLLALFVGIVGTLGLHYLLEDMERQRVRYTFSRFVPENVVDQILADGEEELKLGGARVQATMLFSDIRGFTTYSETRPPDEVVEVLNRYLGAMTDSIMDHGGTLVSYMGDGIMAVFGAPIDQEDHADRAIASSREMLEVKLPAFCEWMREAGYGDGFKIGIGLNTGEVMSGQVGSERRMEYTTIGDTTNTAARLEGMTKGSGYSLFLSESTRAACVGPLPDLDEVGEMEVRGRDEPIQVWGLKVSA